MKVNILGKGLIPGVKRLAPVRGVDLSEKEILKLLTFRYFKLYDAETGVNITNTNVSSFFKPVEKHVEEKPIVVEKKVEEKVVEPVVEKIEVVEEPFTEKEIADEIQKEATPTFLTVTEIPSVEEEIADVIDAEIESENTDAETEDVKETTTENTASRPYYNKKKRRH
jgi:hypothetical protein